MATIRDLINKLTSFAANDRLVVSDTSAPAGSQDKYLELADVGIPALANTWTALQTFDAGIAVGTTGTWTPTISSSTPPTITYSSQTGVYTVLSGLCFFFVSATVNTIGGGSGDVRLSLPFPTVQTTLNVAFVRGVDLPSGPVDVLFGPSTGLSYGRFFITRDNDVNYSLDISALANGDNIQASGFYFV